jgi:hypothetical protein
MSPSEPEHPIDALVRAHLLRHAEGVDAAAILARVRPAERKAPAAPRARRTFLRTVVWSAATAAAVVVAFLGGRYFGPGRASAETLVREARQAHALPVDRCYLVQIVPEPGSVLARFPRLAQPRETRLWTRGDRFFLESTGEGRRGLWNLAPRHWTWGRDEARRVWLALDRTQGIRFDADEPDDVPRAVALACDVCSMRPEVLLDEVLAHFDLKRDSGEGSVGTHRIVAELKAGTAPTWLRSAVLEIDAESRVLRRLVLHRLRNGQPLATVTFTLVDSRPQEDALYTLEGHLDDGVKPYSATFKPLQRARLLAWAFGLPATR